MTVTAKAARGAARKPGGARADTLKRLSTQGVIGMNDLFFGTSGEAISEHDLSPHWRGRCK